MKNGGDDASEAVPRRNGFREAIAAAIAGMLNDWKFDSDRMRALGEEVRRPGPGRRASGAAEGEG